MSYLFEGCNKLLSVLPVVKGNNKKIIIEASDDYLYEKLQMYNNNNKIENNILYRDKKEELSLSILPLLIIKINNAKNIDKIFLNKCKEFKEKNKINKNKGNNTYRIVLQYNKMKISNIMNIIDMKNMLNGCNMLKEVKVINSFNTSKVKDMASILQGCNELEQLDLSIYKTLNVANMENMFNGCHSLKQINGINKFNTEKVLYMNKMFQDSTSLIYLDLSNFNNSNVENMEYMFNRCKNLKEIKGIDRFSNYKVTNLKSMLQDCNTLKYLDLSNFNISNISNMEFMP